ncbi:MAG: GntR family transcriptional regulator [Chloroflexi bacterium]|nr:GntR family transcriptional regulator [Chloroflexota bacterium]
MSHQTQLSQRLHRQLGDLLSELSPGDRLPSEPKLSKAFGVSRATLREAMRTFETQGLIQRRQGVGTFVVHPPGVMDAGLEVLESIETLAERIGLEVSMGAYEVEVRPATASQLSLLKEPELLYVSRVIEAEGRPVAFLEDTLPLSVLSKEELLADFTGSVLDFLLKRGDPSLATSETEIQAVATETHIARALHIQCGDVVLRLQGTLYSAEGAVVALSQSHFLPGYFRFRLLRRVGALEKGQRF